MRELKEQYLLAMAEVIDSDRWSVGPKTLAFEQEYAAWAGRRYAISCASGTAAIEICCRVLKRLQRRRAAHIPELTVPMVGWAAAKAGLTVIRHDVDEQMLMQRPHAMAADEIAIPVWTAGMMSSSVAKAMIPEMIRKGVFVLEDCSHAHGSEFDGVKAGTIGDAAIWSLYSTKVLSCGEGGMIATDDQGFAEECQREANGGKKRGSLVVDIEGACARMSEVSAAIGLVNLRNFDAIWAKRDRIAQTYKDAGVKSMQHGVSGLKPSWYKFTVRHHDPVGLKERAKAAGVYFTQPTHGPDDYGGRQFTAPMSLEISRTHVSLPTWWCSDEQVSKTAAFMAKEMNG